jgi:Tfp pilus assembly protein PilF
VPFNANPQSLRFSQIKYFIGLVDIQLKEPHRAVVNFEESLRAQPGASQAMQMAALLASNEFYEEAMHLSELALAELNQQKDVLLSNVQVSERDIMEFRYNIRVEMDAQGNR